MTQVIYYFIIRSRKDGVDHYWSGTRDEWGTDPHTAQRFMQEDLEEVLYKDLAKSLMPGIEAIVYESLITDDR